MLTGNGSLSTLLGFLTPLWDLNPANALVPALERRFRDHLLGQPLAKHTAMFGYLSMPLLLVVIM